MNAQSFGCRLAVSSCLPASRLFRGCCSLRLPCSIFPLPRVFYSKALTGLCGRLLQLDQSTSHPLTCKQRQAGESKPRYQLERTLPCKSRLGRASPVTNSSGFFVLQVFADYPLPSSSSFLFSRLPSSARPSSGHCWKVRPQGSNEITYVTGCLV